jgi:hypothetical protein
MLVGSKLDENEDRFLKYHFQNSNFYSGMTRLELGFGSSKKPAVNSLDHHFKFDFAVHLYRPWRLKPANDSPAATIWSYDNNFSIFLNVPISNNQQ